MTETVLTLAVIALVLGVGVYLLLRVANTPVSSEPVPVPPPPPVPVPSPVPAPREAAPARTVRIQLVSAKGRSLLDAPLVIDARLRKPVYRHRTRDGLVSVFVADRQDAGGVWVYRRTGVERES